MQEVRLYKHQQDALKMTEHRKRVAYYLDMGLGKTFVGSEKLKVLDAPCALLICQKTKIKDWKTHFETYYDYEVIDYTNPKENKRLTNKHTNIPKNLIIIVNYETAWRRPELLKLRNFTLMLDESSYVKNERSKRGKFALRLRPDNVILLSGTPTGGKYEELYSQCHLLGWKISKKAFYDNYIVTHTVRVNGFPMEIITGYKNVNHLKRKLREHGAVFMKSEEVLTLPEQVETTLTVKQTRQYKQFLKDRIISMNGIDLVGDTTLTYMLYLRQLCGHYNKNKLERLAELLESTDDRLIIFYNFTAEYEAIRSMCESMGKPVSVVNGSEDDRTNYEKYNNSVTLVQYQAGAMGLNLQRANIIVYYTLPLSSELFEQSKKRIHRLGQERTCFYYYLIVEKSIEESIQKTLAKRQDYTDKLFEKGR